MSDAFAGDERRVAGEGASRPVLLRAAREAAGLHIAALAAALKVPVRKLEALEAGRYGELPDMTFARALASSACRQLKVDPGPVLEQIPQGSAPELGASRQGINAPFQSAQDPAPINPLSWLSRPALLAAIVLLLGALVIVFLPRMDEAAQTEVGGANVVVTPVEPVVPSEPVPAQEPLPPAAQPMEGQSPPTDATSGMATQVPVAAGTAPDSSPSVAPAAPGTAAPALVAPAAPASTSLLSIATTGETWIEVVNGAGTVVMQRVLQTGDTVDFSSSPPYSVVLGRAEVAQVTVRGKPFDVSPHIRNNVARFEVK